MVVLTDSEKPGRRESASRRPGEHTERDDKAAAFAAVMKKQVSRAAITIKHTSVTKEELRDLLAPLSHYVRVGHELHKEQVPGHPDDHLHAYVQLSAQKRLGELYRMLHDKFGTRYHGRPDVRQLPSNTDAAKWDNYCKKDGDFVDEGGLRVAGPAPSQKRGSVDPALYHEFLRLAAEEGVDAAMSYASDALVEQYCTRYSALREAAESKKVARSKYDLPSMDAQDVTLRPWQEAWLPRVMERQPQPRRIHWVWGSPGLGKSFAHDYLAANHPHGCFNAGNRCCLDNLVYNYDEEGAILWNFPMNFDWLNMSLAAASVIEKFSDFGTSLRSLKYKGKSCRARGHVIVFANRPPIPELSHRDVREFHIDSYVPPALECKEKAACEGPIISHAETRPTKKAYDSKGKSEPRHVSTNTNPRADGPTGQSSRPPMKPDVGVTEPKANRRKGPPAAPCKGGPGPPSLNHSPPSDSEASTCAPATSASSDDSGATTPHEQPLNIAVAT